MSILVAIFGIGLLIALHELGHLWVARAMGMKVLRYSVGFFRPIAEWTSKRSGIAYQIGAVPLGGFVQIKGMNPFEDGAFEDPDSYQTKPVWRRMLVILAGPVSNFAIAFALFFALFLAGSPEPVDQAAIGRVMPDTPAARSELLRGDRVLELDGEPVDDWLGMVELIRARAEQEVIFVVERDGERLEIAVIPELRGEIGVIGVAQPTEVRRLGPIDALEAAGLKCFVITAGSLAAIGDLISGSAENAQVAGPVGIVKMAGARLQRGVGDFVDILGYLSLMLFLFNLLPLPALDGGRGLLLLVEGVTRRRVRPKVDAVVNTIGFFVIIGLLIVITVFEVADLAG
ncbi:MAG: M50 family metallopeptidase [Polyangia bacterium]